MIIWGLKVLDLGALTFFLVAWLGYAPFLGWRGRIVLDFVIKKISGAKARVLGIVHAPNAEAAIKQSMSDYDLRPTDKSRLIAQPF